MAKGRFTGGRKPGSVNKLTSDVKSMILAALDEVGGKDYLIAQSASNPNAFLTLVGKVLPMHQEHSGSITQRVISGEPLTPEQWAQKYKADD